MKELKLIIRQYLEDTGNLEEITFGKKKRGEQEEKDLIEETAILKIAIIKRCKLNNLMIVVVFSLLILFLGLGVIFLYRYNEDINVLSLIIGGISITIINVLIWLHKLWKEKYYLAFIKAMVENYTPQKAGDVIKTIYNALLSK